MKKAIAILTGTLLVAGVTYAMSVAVTLNAGDQAVVTCNGGNIFETPSPSQVVAVCVGFTATPTRSITATATPTAQATRTPTPTNTPAVAPTTFFTVGLGFSDVSPHALVRTADDRLYAVGNKLYASQFVVYWTAAPGLATAFTGSLTISEASTPLSIDAVYDGKTTIHLLALLNNGQVRDETFSTLSNTLTAGRSIATNGGTVSGDYAGSEGIVGAYDLSGVLHTVYWSSGNHIMFDGSTQLDSAGNAQHPAIAISPLDGSTSVAWVQTDKTVWVRTFSGGTWGPAVQVSTAPAFTAASAGISIDQGPSLLIDAAGKRHLAYIEDWRVSAPYDHGRVHYVANASGSWVDSYIGAYSHDPALALTGTGQLYIIAHGYALNAAPCTSNADLCKWTLGAGGTWLAQIFALHTGSQSFDSSPSVKWSAVGWNRPSAVEFLFFDSGQASPVMYYGRIGQ
jgi:hypothetical protein